MSAIYYFSVMTTSNYQFLSADADVILMSSDPESPMEFRVHQNILSMASPFFHDMFSLPQDAALSSRDKLPIIPVSETYQVMDPLLRFIYPIPNPIVVCLDELNSILGAAVKYEFEVAISALRTLLVSPQFLQASPIRVYAIACRYELPDEAKIASRYTLSVNLLDAPLSDDLKYITAYHYHQLLVLHKHRSRAALAFFAKPDDMIKCMQCNGSTFMVYGSPKWWHEFEARAKEELSVRPTTDVIFGLDFLYRAASTSACPRCPGSVLESWKFLMDLKAAIDALPSTI